MRFNNRGFTGLEILGVLFVATWAVRLVSGVGLAWTAHKQMQAVTRELNCQQEKVEAEYDRWKKENP